MKGGNKSETLLKSQQRLFKLCHTIAIAIQCLAAILFYSRTELNRKVEYLCLEVHLASSMSVRVGSDDERGCE